MSVQDRLPIATCVTMACVWEATAPKPGNVYRSADFDDVSYVDFLTSATVIGPILERTSRAGIGVSVRDAIVATQHRVGTNTNLGTVLLLAPLTAVGRDQRLCDGVSNVLSQLTVDDTRLVYEAIRLARPGGLGCVEDADVHDSTIPPSLVAAMELASQRDLVARQYINRFQDVHRVADWIEASTRQDWALADAIVQAALRLMATEPDTLILRKCGPEVARQAADRAAAALAAGTPADESYRYALADLDFWLRSDGNRRNPGTTADMIAAGLFVLLRDDRLDWPVRFYPSL